MTTDTRPVRRRDDLPSVARLLTVSDNVVAIALTLLALQVKVPPLDQVANPDSAADLAAELAKEAGQLISYLVAFYVVAQFWLTHHRVFRHLADHDEGLAWWNFAFLFTITAIPFTSSLLGQYSNNPLAVDIFAVNLLLATLATRVILLYGRRRDLLAGRIDPRAVWALRARAAGMVVIVALSVSLAWVSTSIAKDCWVLIPLVQWAAERWSAHASSAKAAAALPGQ
jgi:TMEM175 potassium channel family protein